MPSATVAKYLRLYAEPEIALARSIPGQYSAVLVVPAHRESRECIDGFLAAAAAARGRVLLILVVNSRADASPAARLETCALLQSLGVSEFGVLELAELTLAVIDRASLGHELPAKQGVGLARKIGADLALALWAEGRVEQPFVFSTDADTVLPRDYFCAPAAPQAECDAPLCGLLFPFRHVPGSERDVDAATELYELTLRYHVLGLRAAGSPYAYHSIGSCLAVACEAYAHVRGFPKRLAGEDFYLLDKLAKLGILLQRDSEPVQIRSRLSDRVPFGTGPRVLELELERRAGLPVTVYHPDVYAALALVLRGLADVSRSHEPSALTRRLEQSELGSAALRALSGLGLAAELETAAAHTRDETVLLRRLLTWFDALKTLRFIHALRDDVRPNMALELALQTAPFVPREAASGEIPRTLAALAEAERRLFGPRGVSCARLVLTAPERLG